VRPETKRFDSAQAIRYAVFVITSVGVSIWLLTMIWPVVLILVVALILVGALNPFAGFLQRHGFSRRIAVAAILATFVGSLGILALLVMPPLASQLSALFTAAPRIQSRLADELLRHAVTRDLAGHVRAFQLTDVLSRHSEEAVAYSGSAVVGLGVVGTTLALAFYLLADPVRSLALLFALTPRSHHVKIATILPKLETIVGGYMRGQVITSVSIGVFVFALLWAVGISTPMPLAVFAGVTDVLPFVGGLLAMAPAVLAALAKGPREALIVFFSISLYQEFESRILVPRLYGKVLRLPPAAVVIALLTGGTLLGVVGALIALPIAAGLVMLMEELRVEMPGLSVDDGVKQRDEQATRIYETRSEDATPQKAAAIAAEVASESQDNSKPSTPGDD
jgi:putative heme transporter